MAKDKRDDRERNALVAEIVAAAQMCGASIDDVKRLRAGLEGASIDDLKATLADAEKDVAARAAAETTAKAPEPDKPKAQAEDGIRVRVVQSIMHGSRIYEAGAELSVPREVIERMPEHVQELS